MLFTSPARAGAGIALEVEVKRRDARETRAAVLVSHIPSVVSHNPSVSGQYPDTEVFRRGKPPRAERGQSARS